MRHWCLPGAVALLLACGGAEDEAPPLPPPPPPADPCAIRDERGLEVDGVEVKVTSVRRYLHCPDLGPRLQAVLQTSMRFWDTQALPGVILIRDGALTCVGVEAIGCATLRDDDKVAIEITTDVSVYGDRSRCIEDTPVPHEMGHVALGDWYDDHKDPRYQTVERSVNDPLVRQHLDCYAMY